MARREDKEQGVLQEEITCPECPLQIVLSPLRTPVCKYPRTRCPRVLSLPAESGSAWSCSCDEGTSQPDGDTHPGADATHAGLAVAGRPGAPLGATGAQAAICGVEISRPQSACSSLRTLLPQQRCPALWTEDRICCRGDPPCAGERGVTSRQGRGLSGQALIFLSTHSAQRGGSPSQPS